MKESETIQTVRGLLGIGRRGDGQFRDSNGPREIALAIETLGLCVERGPALPACQRREKQRETGRRQHSLFRAFQSRQVFLNRLPILSGWTGLQRAPVEFAGLGRMAV